MTQMSNDQIRDDVYHIIKGYINSVKGGRTTQDIEIIDAGARLMINFLQNLNDIAYAAIERNERESQQ